MDSRVHARASLDTTDVEEARWAVGDIFCPHTLTPLRGTAVATQLRSARIGAIGLSFLDYGVPVAIDPGRLEDFYLVQVPLSGQARIAHGDDSVLSTHLLASVLSPDDMVSMQWGEHNPQQILYVNRDALHAQLARMLDRPAIAPTKFSPGMRINGQAGQAFWRGMEFARDELVGNSPLLISDSGIKQVEQLLMTRLLLTQPHNYSDALAESKPPLSHTVRSACDLINDHIAEPLTVADLAEAVGVSVRSLQHGFRRDLNTSPTHYLRERRMAKAHELLRASSTATTSVTEVATSLGFLHLGRFSVEYRRCFGESPSQSLHHD